MSRLNRILSRSEYFFVLYGLGGDRLPGQVADALRFLAYRLEAGVNPSRSQRERLVVELAVVVQLRAWQSYETRLWYYISSAQFADPRLAQILLRNSTVEEDEHLKVWGLLATATSAGASQASGMNEHPQAPDMNKIRSDAFSIGQGHCSVFPTMFELLTKGNAGVDEVVKNAAKLSAVDLEFLLLAFGRNQLVFSDEHSEKYFREFVTVDGVQHPSAVVSEYSYWSTRVRKLDLPEIDGCVLDRHQHSSVPRVRSSIYRLLGSHNQGTRIANWEFLTDQQKTEDGKCRFEIFSSLSARVGTYDSLSLTRDEAHLKAFIEWHMVEWDERCADRQFAFLIHNIENLNVQNYLIEEISAADPGRIRSYIPHIRRNRHLPSRFVQEMQRIGVLSVGEQLDFANLGHANEWRQLAGRTRTMPTRHLQNTIIAESIEENLARRLSLSEMGTVVIATANKREAQAVIGELRRRSEALAFPITTEPDDVLPYNEGRLQGRNRLHKTVVVRADDTGPLDATDLLRRIVESFAAKYIFFVGCAALLDEKQAAEPGTVFVARRAVDVDKREEGDDGADYDMDLAQGDARILRNLDAIMDAGHLGSLNVVTNRYFLSGSAFVGNRESDARKAYVSKFPKDAVVLEMEAYAVLKAVQLRRLEGQDLAVSVIKGISDFGDENAQIEKGEAQMRATTNAMQVACKLLEFM